MAKSDAYRDAGVDVEAGEQFAELIKHHLRRTHGPRVLPTKTGFAGLFRLDYDRKLFARNYHNPVLAGCTDGVGTKLKVAFAMNHHRSVGIDLVAMSVNDLIVRGAEPLFFVDYIAVGKLSKSILVDVVAGIADGCLQADCALLGGETAEHPGDFPDGQYDLAGFCVGIVERNRIVDGSDVEKGDAVIGLSSSGLHSNGYSLARKLVFEKAGLTVDSYVPELGRKLGDEMLRPTRIYVKPVLNVLRYYRVKKVVKAIAHITGGAFYEKIPRVLPDGFGVRLNKGSWPVLPIFPFLQQIGSLSDQEMYSVFNMGIGMVMIVSPFYADSVVDRLRRSGEQAQIIGRVVRSKTPVDFE
jgi:phosphoribosylformylglycinamidine cyclo-ligase